jgi:hypothetical protein
MYRTKRMALVWGMMAMLIVATTACTLFGPPQWSNIPLSIQADTLYTSEQRTWNFDAPPHGTVLLSIEARIGWYQLAGAYPLMELRVNDRPVTADMLINKPITFTLADGRSFSYYLRQTPDSDLYWDVFYSPDFESNNVADSQYRVLEGQAYLYTFDITPLLRHGQTNTIILINRSERLQEIEPGPIPLVFRQAKLMIRSR